MKIKIIDYLGKEQILEGVKNIYFAKRGYKVETAEGEWIWRECCQFRSEVQPDRDFDHIITEW